MPSAVKSYRTPLKVKKRRLKGLDQQVSAYVIKRSVRRNSVSNSITPFFSGEENDNSPQDIRSVSLGRSKSLGADNVLWSIDSEDIRAPPRKRNSLDPRVLPSANSILHSIDIDQNGNIQSGINLSTSATESFLRRTKSTLKKDILSYPTSNIYGSLDSVSNQRLVAIKQLAQSGNKAKKDKGNSLLMKQLKLLDSRGMAHDTTGITSSTLIDYAFVVGPNIEDLKTAFSADSRSRSFQFLNSTTMRSIVDPELLYIDKLNVSGDLEVDALSGFCFPSGIEVTGKLDTVSPQTTAKVNSMKRKSSIHQMANILNFSKYTFPFDSEEYSARYRSQSFVFMLQNHTSTHFGICLVVPRSFRDIEKEITVNTSYCICLVTEYPYFSFLIDALQQFNKMGGFDLDLPIETLSEGLILHNQLQYFNQFVNKLQKSTVPGMGRMVEINFVLNNNSLLSSMLRLHGPQKGVDPVIEKENEICYHTMLWGLPTLLSVMPLDQIILALGCALTEMKIVVVSDQLKEVSAAILCLINLLRPLRWSCPAIVTCPDIMLPYLEAPCPIIVGLRKLPEHFTPARGMAILDMSNVDTSKNCVGLHFDDVVTSHTLNMPQSNKLCKLTKDDVESVLSILKKYAESSLVYRDGQAWETYMFAPELNMSSQDGMDLRSAVDSIASKIHKHIVTVINTSIVQDNEAKAQAARKRALSRIQSTRLSSTTSCDNLLDASQQGTSSSSIPALTGTCFTSKEVGEKGKIFIRRFLDSQMYSDYCYRLDLANSASTEAGTVPHNSTESNISSSSHPRSVRLTRSLSTSGRQSANIFSGRFKPISSAFEESPSRHSLDSSNSGRHLFMEAGDDPWTAVFGIIMFGTSPLPEDLLESLREYYRENIYPPYFILPALADAKPMRSVSLSDRIFCRGLCRGKADTPLCNPLCREIWVERQDLRVLNKKFTQHMGKQQSLLTISPVREFEQQQRLPTAKSSTFYLKNFSFQYPEISNRKSYQELVVSLQRKKHDVKVNARRRAKIAQAVVIIQKYIRRYLAQARNQHIIIALIKMRRARHASILRRIVHKAFIGDLIKKKAFTDSKKVDVSAPTLRRASSQGHVLDIFITMFRRSVEDDKDDAVLDASMHSQGTSEVQRRSQDMKKNYRGSAVQIDTMRRHLNSQESICFSKLPVPLRFLHRSVLAELIPQQRSLLMDMYDLLRHGAEILKHNKWSRPKIRYLYCDAFMKKLYWRKNRALARETSKNLRASFDQVQFMIDQERAGCLRRGSRGSGLGIKGLDFYREIYLEEILEVEDIITTEVMKMSQSKGFFADGIPGYIISIKSERRTLDFEIDASNFGKLFRGLKVLILSQDRAKISSSSSHLYFSSRGVGSGDSQDMNERDV